MARLAHGSLLASALIAIATHGASAAPPAPRALPLPYNMSRFPAAWFGGNDTAFESEASLETAEEERVLEKVVAIIEYRMGQAGAALCERRPVLGEEHRRRYRAYARLCCSRRNGRTQRSGSCRRGFLLVIHPPLHAQCREQRVR